VVDISGSMQGNDRLALAMGELRRSLEALPDFAQFKVALYSNDVLIPPIQSGWLRASRARVRTIANWLEREVRASGSTFPLPAFRYLWSDDEPPDVVFFLTDGEIPQSTGAEVLALNARPRGRPAVINCIAFSADASQGVLREIASRSEGVFRFVPDQRRRP
jgi:predicted metal-dependent peptidase